MTTKELTKAELALRVTETRRVTQEAREALIQAEVAGKGVVGAKRALKKAIIAGDKATVALKAAGAPAIPDPDEMKTDVRAPDAPAAGSEWEQRMSEQRRQWRKQDDSRYINPTFDPELNAVWNVYEWSETDGLWFFAGEKLRKPGRRKPMTMNRLFAGIRQRFQIKADVPLKLITKQDDVERIRLGQLLAAPERKKTTAPDKPDAKALETPGKQAKSTVAYRRNGAVQPHPVDGPAKRAEIEKAAKSGKQIAKEVIAKKAAKPKAQTDRVKFAVWGTHSGRSEYLGASKLDSRTAAQAEVLARFPDHTKIKTKAITSLSYSLRNEIASGELAVGSEHTP